MMVSPTNYIAERRYYWPIVPLAVLVAYSIFSAVDHFAGIARREVVPAERAVSIWLDTSR